MSFGGFNFGGRPQQANTPPAAAAPPPPLEPWGPLNPNRHGEASQVPADAVSCLAFDGEQPLLAAGSWDCQAHVYTVSENGPHGRAERVAVCAATAPVLACVWRGGGPGRVGRPPLLCYAGCDGKIYRQEITPAGPVASTPVAAHESPIRSLLSPGSDLLMSGSWDKTLRGWDLRAPLDRPVFSIAQPERVYAADARGPCVLVATAEKHVLAYDLRNMGPAAAPQEVVRVVSPLTYQTRCVGLFADLAGYAIGSIEGRCGIQYFGDTQGRSFVFKCHRRNANEVYQVNAVGFHPVHNTFATGGSDGEINFWDKDAKSRLRQWQRCGLPVSALAWSPNGLFAYAISYDWSRGAQGRGLADRNAILLLRPADNDIFPKNVAGRR